MHSIGASGLHQEPGHRTNGDPESAFGEIMTPVDPKRLRAECDAEDEELMARVRNGDAEAYERLLNRYWRRLVQYGADMLGDVDAAQDLAQETFVRVWERRMQWKPSGSVQSFLYVITRNLALKALKKDAVRRRWRVAKLKEPKEDQPSIEEVFEEDEVRRELACAIQALPERRRETLLLIRFHGMSYREVAEVMGVSPQTVANQMSAALSELRKSISGRPERFRDSRNRSQRDSSGERTE